MRSVFGVLSLTLLSCDWNYSKVCIEEKLTVGLFGFAESVCVRWAITRTGPDGGMTHEEWPPPLHSAGN